LIGSDSIGSDSPAFSSTDSPNTHSGVKTRVLGLPFTSPKMLLSSSGSPSRSFPLAETVLPSRSSSRDNPTEPMRSQTNCWLTSTGTGTGTCGSAATVNETPEVVAVRVAVVLSANIFPSSPSPLSTGSVESAALGRGTTHVRLLSALSVHSLAFSSESFSALSWQPIVMRSSPATSGTLRSSAP
jgi:hypothetical protein